MTAPKPSSELAKKEGEPTIKRFNTLLMTSEGWCKAGVRVAGNLEEHRLTCEETVLGTMDFNLGIWRGKIRV
jgi:hypothetical protein